MAKQQTTTKAQQQKKAKRKKIILTSFLTVVIIGLILSTFFMIEVIGGLPSLQELENPKPILASKVYSDDGEVLGQFFIENRSETNLDSVPQHFIDGLVATEDRKFYDHWGVDLDRFSKAMVKNVLTFSREGASTLTQQLAKNLYKLWIKNETMYDKVVRKVREWITAIQIEKTYTKREILELYLTISPFGRGAYGIESAAKIYFNKRAYDLTVPESALLIALLKSSVNYDPIRRTQNAIKRRNLVMRQMVDVGYLSEVDYQRYKDEPIKVTLQETQNPKTDAPHFLEYVRQSMQDEMAALGYDIYRDGLRIYTTVDMRMQRIANNSVKTHLKEYQELFNSTWSWERNQNVLNALVEQAARNTDEYRSAANDYEKREVIAKLKKDPGFVAEVKKTSTTIQAGFVVVEPGTGHIKALVGGENLEFLYGLNHVTQIHRQPGSSFKPIVYAVAINNGYFPSYPVSNEPLNYKGWSPRGGGQGGYLTLRQGLQKSVNVIAARLIVDGLAPVNQVVELAHRMGIKGEIEPFPSISLGTEEVTPLEMAGVFGTFANHGVYVSPIGILRVEDKDGVLIKEYYPERREAMSEKTASIMTNLLQAVVDGGTGSGVRRYFSRPAAGKTGTTQDFSDAWFCGYTPHLVAATWVGFDDRRVHFTGWYGQGARAALPIWAMFMSEVYKQFEYPLDYFPAPQGLIRVSFCKEALEMGELRVAGPNCPETVSGLIDPNQKPPECEIHSGDIYDRSGYGDSGW